LNLGRFIVATSPVSLDDLYYRANGLSRYRNAAVSRQLLIAERDSLTAVGNIRRHEYKTVIGLHHPLPSGR
jgi:hypothetical protein